MVRIGLYLDPQRHEWLVIRVRATPILRILHGACYITFRGTGHTIGAYLPRPILDHPMSWLRSGCWTKPGWFDQATQTKAYNVSPAAIRVALLAFWGR